MHDHASFNRAYRLVFNASLGQVVVVPETARGGSAGATAAGRVPTGPGPLRRIALALAFALAAPAAWGLDPGALPQGEQVAAGRASVTRNSATLTVQQASDRAIVNWHSFDIGSGAAVRFVQPSSGSVTLNRVTGGQASQVFGSMTANGQVYLVNSAGILFGRTAQVDVGGLVASTLGMRDGDFLAGRDTFAGQGAGSVTNLGRIQARNGGRVALLGGTVRNDGQIFAPGGDVALAAGSQVRLAIGAGGHLQVAIDAADVATLAANGGLVQADGGQVVLTARAANALAAGVVSNTGTLQARTVAQQAGRILLLGDMDHGIAQVGGTLDASAPQGSDGGFVETSAAEVRIAAGTRVDTRAASGTTGRWLIDPTDFHIAAGSGSQTAAGVGADTLVANLASTSVEIATSASGSEAGDIHVDAAVRWNAPTTLTLTAHGAIHVDAPITVQHAGGGVALNHGAGADYQLRAPISFTAGNGGSFSVNGQAYTLLHGMAAIDAIDGTGLAGRYALARDVDAGGTNYAASVVAPLQASPFSGTFAGLGHTIRNLRMATGADGAGLFGYTQGATFRNIGLDNVNVSGDTHAGSLVGVAADTRISQAWAQGTVQAVSYAGGIAGYLSLGSIADSYATVSATSQYVGGLVGHLAGGSIARSYAAGALSGLGGSSPGGLAGTADTGSAIVDSYWSNNASSAVRGGTATGFANGYRTVAQLQSALPAGFDASVWGNAGNRSTPYLLSNPGRAFIASDTGNTQYTIVRNAEQLQAMRDNLAGRYALGNDIDASGTVQWNGGAGFEPVGAPAAQFSGTLDGLGFAVQSLAINRPTQDFVGLFGYTSGGAIRDLGLVGGRIVGQDITGALVGKSYSVISRAYSTAAVSGAVAVGGLVGGSNASVRDSYATGAVNGDWAVGGLVGDNFGTLSSSYASGNVFSAGGVGGLVGTNNGVLTDVYATGAVTGTANTVGGLAGYSAGEIRNAYASGSVSGATQVGGLVGRFTGIASNSFWNVETSGQAIGIGEGSAAGTAGKTSAQMQQLSTFAGWDIDGAGGTGKAWRIYEGHAAPLLRTFLRPLDVQPAYDGSGAALADIAGYVLAPGGDPALVRGTAPTRLVLSGGAAGSYSAALEGGDLYSGQQGYDLTIASRTISTPGAAAGDIRLDNPVAWTSGTLALRTSGSIRSGAAIAGGADSVFDLQAGTWVQDATTLPAFDVHDFRISGGIFHRTIHTGGWGGGSYRVADIYGLQGAKTLLAGNFELDGNIDASGTAYWYSGAGFDPVGTQATPFTGTLDGRGYAVRSLTINRPIGFFVGLLGYAGTGSGIRNIGIEGGSVMGDYFTGALVARSYGTISHAYSTASVWGSTVAGGLAGDVTNGSLSDSYATGNVGGYTTVGGLVGQSNSPIVRSYASGNVSGMDLLGGLVGLSSGDIVDSYASGNVAGGSFIGVGGLVGGNDGTIRNAYASGSVTGDRVGGFAGRNSGTVLDSFWNTQSSGQAGATADGSTIGAAGMTTSQMRQLATFAGWDIDAAGGTGKAWRIYEGHTAPLLRGFLTGVTVTADGTLPGKTYDGTVASGTGSYAVSDPAATLSGDLAYASTGANAGTYSTGAGTLLLGGLYSGQQGYDISYGTGSVAIARKALTIDGITAQDKVYDRGTNATVTFTGLGGVVGSDDVGLALGGASFADWNAGTGKAVTVSGTTLDGAAAGNYTIADPTGLLAAITPKAVTGTITAQGKVYDRSTSATTSGTFSGILAGDTVGLTAGGAFRDWNAGNGKTVDVRGTLSGADAGNYALVTNSTATADITPKAITATITAADKVYDRSTGATTSGTLGGVISGDTVGLVSSGAFRDWNAGSGKTVDVNGALSGADAGNYAVATNSTTSADITRRAIAGTITAAGKVYDGTTAAVTGGSLAGVLAGDDVALAASGAFSDANAGKDKPVGVRGAVSGADAGNYDVAMNSAATADITPAPLLVTANDLARSVDGQPFSGGNGVRYEGFVAGQDASMLGGSLRWGGSAQGAIGPGSYSLSAFGLATGNYGISYRDGVLAMTQERELPAAGQVERQARQSLGVAPGGPVALGGRVPLVVADDYLRVD